MISKHSPSILYISGDDVFFEINSTTGQIKNKQVLDYETAFKKFFSLTVTVHDLVHNAASQQISITLANINDNLPLFVNPLSSEINTKEIAEGTESDTEIYTLLARDADGDNITYSLVSQTPADPPGFELRDTKVYTTTVFDYEQDPISYDFIFE